MKFFGYEILNTGDAVIPFNWANRKFWLSVARHGHTITSHIIQLEARRLFGFTVWGMAITHKTWERYKHSPLFGFRYKQIGIDYAVESFSIQEFNFFRRQVWSDKEFLTDLFWHPYETLYDLVEEDTFWKERWVKALQQKG